MQLKQTEQHLSKHVAYVFMSTLTAAYHVPTPALYHWAVSVRTTNDRCHSRPCEPPLFALPDGSLTGLAPGNFNTSCIYCFTWMLCLQQRCNQATFNFSEGVINQHLTEAVLSKCRDQSETLSEPVLGLVQGLPLSARLNLIKQHALINPATLNEFVTAKTSYRKTSNSQGRCKRWGFTQTNSAVPGMPPIRTGKSGTSPTDLGYHALYKTPLHTSAVPISAVTAHPQLSPAVRRSDENATLNARSAVLSFFTTPRACMFSNDSPESDPAINSVISKKQLFCLRVPTCQTLLRNTNAQMHSRCKHQNVTYAVLRAAADRQTLKTVRCCLLRSSCWSWAKWRTATVESISQGPLAQAYRGLFTPDWPRIPRNSALFSLSSADFLASKAPTWQTRAKAFSTFAVRSIGRGQGYTRVSWILDSTKRRSGVLSNAAPSFLWLASCAKEVHGFAHGRHTHC